MLTSILVLLGILILDRIVKVWAIVALQPVGTIPVVENAFYFTYTENTGAAFSILRNHSWIIISITVLVSIALLYYVFFKNVKPSYKYPMLFVAAGGMGNLIDRILYGFVVDMFDFRLINFAIFNIADIFITVGGIWFIISYLFFNKKKKPDMEIDSDHANDMPVRK